MLLHPELLLAARLALGLTREGIAREAGIGVRTLADLESGRRSSVETYILVSQALESHGIIFIPSQEQQGPGFRLPKGWSSNPIVVPRKTRRAHKDER